MLKNCLRIVATIGFMANTPEGDFLKCDVLSKDRQKFDQADEEMQNASLTGLEGVESTAGMWVRTRCSWARLRDVQVLVLADMAGNTAMPTFGRATFMLFGAGKGEGTSRSSGSGRRSFGRTFNLHEWAHRTIRRIERKASEFGVY